jgi:dihydrofolate reductase
MRLVLSNFISLDGVVQAPGGPEEDTDGGFAHGGWSHPFFDPEVMGAAIDAGMATVDALLFGRRTYATMAAAFAESDDPFATHFRGLPKYVASRSYAAADVSWANTTLLPASDAVGAIRELKAGPRRDLQVFGSSDLARQLIAADLVDEYVLMVEPIRLGGGKRLFPDDGQARPLELVSHQVAPTGVIVCTYRPVR